MSNMMYLLFFDDGRRLMVLSWAGFIHFFDVPSSSNVKKDASPAAAFQEISPSISVSFCCRLVLIDRFFFFVAFG